MTSGNTLNTGSLADFEAVTALKPLVFVVDDDSAMRNSLRWLIESIGLEVRTFSSAIQFLKTYDSSQPGCLVLDVRMPGMSGMELLEKLAAMPYAPPTLIITGHGDVPMAVRAIKHGALDFIQKPFNDNDLLDRIQHAIATDAKRRQTLDSQQDIDERFTKLSRREWTILEHVLAGNSNTEISSDLSISIRTVEVHRAHIMRKLAAKNVADLVRLYLTYQAAHPKANLA